MGIIISFTSATVTAVTKHIAKEFESQAMRAPLLFLLLAASGCILGSTRCAKETTIELLSAPIKLRYGQVHDGGIDGSVAGKFSIPYTVGHLHVGGIDISLYDDSTGELICRSEAIYGNGTEPANEENYIVGMTPCYFDDPPVFNKNDKLRIVSRYNNAKPHFGVMSLFPSTSHEIDA